MISYYLSRTLGEHVGWGRRFQSLRAHMAFNRAVETHCREVSAIVEVYSGDWFSSHQARAPITPESVRTFLHGAFEKLGLELGVRHG